MTVHGNLTMPRPNQAHSNHQHTSHHQHQYNQHRQFPRGSLNESLIATAWGVSSNVFFFVFVLHWVFAQFSIINMCFAKLEKKLGIFCLIFCANLITQLLCLFSEFCEINQTAKTTPLLYFLWWYFLKSNHPQKKTEKSDIRIQEDCHDPNYSVKGFLSFNDPYSSRTEKCFSRPSALFSFGSLFLDRLKVKLECKRNNNENCMISTVFMLFKSDFLLDCEWY